MKHHHRVRQFVILLVLLGSIFLYSFLVNAQSNPVSIIDIVIYCDHIDMTFNTTGITDADQIDFVINSQGSTYLGGAGRTNLGPAGNPHNIILYFDPPQPNGTLISVDYGLPASMTTYGPVACGSGGVTTPPPPSGGGGTEPTPDTGTGSGGWEGYNDGRLDPDPAEYYSLYCGNDELHVWANDNLLTSINISTLLNMDAGDSVVRNGVTIGRETEVETATDVFYASGGNGNTAPSTGIKRFTMGECLASNGPITESNLPDDDDYSAPVVDCSFPGNQPQITLDWSRTPDGYTIYGSPYEFAFLAFANPIIIDVLTDDLGDTLDIHIVSTDVNEANMFFYLFRKEGLTDYPQSIGLFRNDYAECDINHPCDGLMQTGYPLQIELFYLYDDPTPESLQPQLEITATNELGCTATVTSEFRVFNPFEGEGGPVREVTIRGLTDFITAFCGNPTVFFGLAFFPFFWIRRRRRKVNRKDVTKSISRFP